MPNYSFKMNKENQFHTTSVLVPEETWQIQGGRSPSRNEISILIVVQPLPVSLLEFVDNGAVICLSSFDSSWVPVPGCCQSLDLGVFPAPLLKLLPYDAWQMLLMGLSG